MSTLQPKGDIANEVIRRHWNSRAAGFDEEDLSHGLRSEPQHQAWLALLGRLAGPPPKRILDVGCGTGFLALLFAELGHRVTGIDFAEQMLEIARSKAAAANLEIEFRWDDAMALTDADGSYDLVVSRHVLWTLPDPSRGIDQWLRVMRPGARLVLVEENLGVHQRKRARRWSVRQQLANIAFPGLIVLSWFISQKQWPWLHEKVEVRRYRRTAARLPFFGGAPAQRLVGFLQEHGLREIAVESLMDATLWGKVPKVERFMILGRR